MVRSSSDSLVRSEQFSPPSQIIQSLSNRSLLFFSLFRLFRVALLFLRLSGPFRAVRSKLSYSAVPVRSSVSNSPVPFKLEKDPKRQSAGRENTDRAGRKLTLNDHQAEKRPETGGNENEA